MWDVKDYFGRVYKNRELPQGIYEHNDKFRYVHFLPSGKVLKTKVCDTLEQAIKELKDLRDGHHWYGIQHDPKNNFGFIYRITEMSTGRQYLGSKQYRRWNGPRGGYKCTDVTDKEWFNEDLWVDNDWRYYKGSCAPLTEAIMKNPDDFFYETVSLHKDKLELHLAEIAIQVEENVLEAELPDGSFKYFNANIASKLFKAPLSKTEMREMQQASYEFMQKEINRYITMPNVCSCGKPLNYGELPCH